ncbi:hypothetical protein DI272_18555 [Streptomyces sp. Act143]|uniref:hypothetical protein n=1 Tax=Streptomyces sp. Act143 TaxID=2200760 RepID=UPI000D6733B6|nr:hypothetical protein [Streptomyces sp. Act143]PWI15940.1 hypothetical protein DI272_18555 [Streptomyces sp. Act143]
MQAGDNVTISGSGSAANPYVVSAEVPCEAVRPCLSGGPGITYDQGSGVIAAHLSGQAGNNVSIGPDGGLLVPTAGGQVLTGCGLSGNGTAGSPVKANTQAWPYPCSVDTFGGVVACDSQGRLRSEPRGMVSFTSYSESRDYNDVPIPAAQNTALDTFSVNITNPDTCRPAKVFTEREIDVWMVLPAGAAGGTGVASDEMFYMRNTGTGSIVGVHSQGTKFLAESFTLAPGASAPITLTATGGRGSGGAYYYSIVFIMRAMIISL